MGCATQRPLRQDPSWPRDVCAHLGGPWYTQDMDCEPSKSKWRAKGKPEKMPHISELNCREEATQDSPSESACVSMHTRCTLFPANKTLYLLHYVHLCGSSFLQSRGAGALVTDHWPSGWDPVLSWLQPSPHLWMGTQAPSKLLQAEDTQDQRSVLSMNYFLDTHVTSAQNPRFTLHSLVATRDNSDHTEFRGSYKGGGVSQGHTNVPLSLGSRDRIQWACKLKWAKWHLFIFSNL